MPAYLTDENFNFIIIDALLLKVPAIDIIRVQSVGLLAAPDPEVLAWAADHGRILMTHDVDTMPKYAYSRARRLQPMAGVIVVSSLLSIGRAVEDIQILHECISDAEWQHRVEYVPL
jgi:hypothetical protein